MVLTACRQSAAPSKRLQACKKKLSLAQNCRTLYMVQLSLVASIDCAFFRVALGAHTANFTQKQKPYLVMLLYRVMKLRKLS